MAGENPGPQRGRYTHPTVSVEGKMGRTPRPESARPPDAAGAAEVRCVEAMEAPFLRGVSSLPEKVRGRTDFPFNLPFVGDLSLVLGNAVTYFVGENGSGKSTVLEAIAALSRLPISGG